MRYTLTMEEAAEIEVHKRGQREVTSKRPLALIREEANPTPTKEPAKKKNSSFASSYVRRAARPDDLGSVESARQYYTTQYVEEELTNVASFSSI
ncbi:hypothetical protein ACLOJK_001146 [Asimina triloba]